MVAWTLVYPQYGTSLHPSGTHNFEVICYVFGKYVHSCINQSIVSGVVLFNIN